jgi:hypothetical protein
VVLLELVVLAVAVMLARLEQIMQEAMDQLILVVVEEVVRFNLLAAMAALAVQA